MRISPVDAEALERAASTRKGVYRRTVRENRLDHVSILNGRRYVRLIDFIVIVEQYVEPGAGLRKLEDNVQDSDFIFDSIFQLGEDAIMSDFQPSRPMSPIVRAYQSDRDM